MTIDCSWLNDNLEAYCCDRLSAEEQRLAKSHLETCETCRRELESIEAIDPLVRNLVQYRLSVAAVPRRRRLLAPAVAACAAAVLAVVAVSQLKPDPPQPVQSSSIALPAPDAIEPVVPKSEEPGNVTRAKPEAPPAPSPAPAPVLDSNAPNPVEAFAVIDQAGYVRRLNDYRGYVLLFGVCSKDQPAAAANLEQVYRTFGTSTKLRLLGVSPDRQNSPAGVTFPVVYNQESRLLGAHAGEYVVVDASGAELVRGSLLTDPATLIRSLRAILPSPAKE